MQGIWLSLQDRRFVKRYGLKAYKEGWKVYTTIKSEYQIAASASIHKHLALYDKKAWLERC